MAIEPYRRLLAGSLACGVLLVVGLVARIPVDGDRAWR